MSIKCKLEPYNINELKRQPLRPQYTGPVDNFRFNLLLEEFTSNKYDCCEIKCNSCIDIPQACIIVTDLNKIIKRRKLDEIIKVVRRKNRVYLVRKDKWEGKTE